MKKLRLGILYKDGNIVAHRSLLQIVANPFLRKIGFEIISVFEKDEFVKYKVKDCKPAKKISWELYNNEEYDSIKKKHTIL